MTRLDSTRTALDRLAEAIETRGGELLEMWRDRVVGDATLDLSSEWSLKQLNDHFPDVLEALARALRAWPELPCALAADEHGYAVSHARARWVQGYSLRGVVREWGHFNAVVADQLVALTPGGDPALARAALDVWSRVLNDQQALSALEYHQLEQSEAETRGAELLRALDSLRSGSLMRGRAIEALASTMRNDLQVVMTSNSLSGDGGACRDDDELRKLSHDGFRGLEQALSDMVTLAHLEAGHESPVIERFDAAHGLALLVEGLQHVAAQAGADLRAEGPDSLPVEGDPERVRRLAKHLLFCALRAPAPQVRVHWGACDDEAPRWRMRIEHAVHCTRPGDGSGVGHAIARGTEAEQEVTGVPPSGGEQALESGAIPVAEGDGVDLLIAKHLCDLLGGGLHIEADDDTLRYQVTLPMQYRPSATVDALSRHRETQDAMRFGH